MGGYGYFIVKTALPFSAKKWPHGCKVEKKLCPSLIPPKGNESTKGRRKAKKYRLLGALTLGVISLLGALNLGVIRLLGIFGPFGTFRPFRPD